MGLRSYITKKIATALFQQMGFPFYNGNAPIITNEPYNGEKNAGELGAVKNYIPDFQTLSARSWQAYTESEIAQLIIHNFLLWTIGTGLKFKAEPSREILDEEKIKVDLPAFIKTAESRFNLHLDSKRSTSTRMRTFNQLTYQAKKHAIVGGDVLVVLDYGRPKDLNKSVSARLIDGYYVQSPVNNVNPNNSNKIYNGVEINDYGEAVAYWVRLDNLQCVRVEAYTKTGTLQAFMVYGLDYRTDTFRGMPLLSAVLETMKKLDRYKEATVGSAEERAKITWFVEHAQYSTGEDPVSKLKAAAGHGVDPGTERITNELLKTTASNIRYTTGKQTLNMPIGATLKSLDAKNELYFRDFYNTNFEILCAAIGIPPEVALNKYTSSFSSSRGANKNWEHKILFEREKIDLELYQPFFNYWLEMEVYSGRIELPGYVVAKYTDDYLLLEAYQKCRFIGAKMPFIDPLKEVQAARAKLGDQSTPLATYEQVTEELNGGDWQTNIEQAKLERDKATGLGFDPGKSQNSPDLKGAGEPAETETEPKNG
jgi:capsid protein